MAGQRRAGVGHLRLLSHSQVTSAKESIVLGVAADPPPENAVVSVCAEGAVVEADADRPILSDALQLQGRMPRVGDEQLVVRSRETLNFARELPEQGPEVRARVVVQNFVLFPTR